MSALPPSSDVLNSERVASPDDVESTPSKLRIALALADQGYRVFPLVPGGKLPAIGGWPQRASANCETVRKMWSSHDPVNDIAYERDFNIGIATGACAGRFLTVLDVDVKNGGKGLETLERIDISAPDAWREGAKRVDTPSGGFHLYFFSDAPLGTSASRLGPGIDTRGVGGYVVAEGSTMADGRAYVACGGALRTISPWLANDIGAPIERADANVLCLLDSKPALDRASAWLKDIAPLAVQGAGGDATTFKVAAGVKDFGVSSLACQELMVTLWNDRCSPPWDYEALSVKVDNAYRYGANSAGCKDPSTDFEPVEAEADPFDPKPTHSPDMFKFERFSSMKPDLARRDLIKGVMLRVSTVGLIGAPNAGKSQAEAHLAYAIAAGEDWCGRRVMPGAVICALGEGAEGFRGRVQAIREAKGCLSDIPFFMVPKIPNLTSRGEVGAFIAAVKSLMALEPETELRAIFFDTLTTATPGGDQNATDMMSTVVGSLRLISQELDCCSIVIHHVGKDATKGGRGSSVLNGDLDTELLVEANTRGGFTIRQTKQRDFDRGKVFTFAQKQAVLGYDVEGDPVTAVYAEEAAGSDLEEDFADTPDDNLSKHEQHMLDLLDEAPGEWHGRIDLQNLFVETWFKENPRSTDVSNKASYRRAIDSLVKRSEVIERGAGRKRVYKAADNFNLNDRAADKPDLNSSDESEHQVNISERDASALGLDQEIGSEREKRAGVSL